MKLEARNEMIDMLVVDKANQAPIEN